MLCVSVSREDSVIYPLVLHGWVGVGQGSVYVWMCVHVCVCVSTRYKPQVVSYIVIT